MGDALTRVVPAYGSNLIITVYAWVIDSGTSLLPGRKRSGDFGETTNKKICIFASIASGEFVPVSLSLSQKGPEVGLRRKGGVSLSY